MGAIGIDGLRERALVLLDAPPIIYFVEDHPQLAPRFEPLFAAHAAARVRIAITTITIAEVLIGPLRSGNEALERRYHSVLATWQQVPLDFAIAEGAARLRASLGFKLPDAIQAASALAVNADALVTHDRDFSRLKALRVIS